MSYDEEQTRRSRVVVETPTERREVVQHQTVRYPEERRGGFSTGMVVTVALLAIAATAIIFLFLTNSRDDSTAVNVNMRAATQPTPMTQTPVIVTQPAAQPTPIIITQPAPVSQPAPVVIQQAPPTTTTAPPSAADSAASKVVDDSGLRQKIDKAFEDDTELSAVGIIATVTNGRATLTGTVNTDALKRKAERLAYAVKGVTGVENRITVSPAP